MSQLEGTIYFSEPKPGRAYLFRQKNTRAFWDTFSGLQAPADYLNGVLEEHRGLFRDMNYLLAGLWLDKDQRMMDIFGFYDLGLLPSNDMGLPPGNPTVAAWVARNGVIQPTRDATCGTMLMILGREEAHRRTLPDLDTYLAQAPDLDFLEPGIEYRPETHKNP